MSMFDKAYTLWNNIHKDQALFYDALAKIEFQMIIRQIRIFTMKYARKIPEPS